MKNMKRRKFINQAEDLFSSPIIQFLVKGLRPYDKTGKKTGKISTVSGGI